MPDLPFLWTDSYLEQMLLQLTKSADGFPPYDLERLDDNHVLLTLAVAGYAEQDLEVIQDQTKLIIKGHQSHKPERKFLHHGIAGRSFIKSFILMANMQVEQVILENGLLTIHIVVLAEQMVKKIPILSKEKKVSLTEDKA